MRGRLVHDTNGILTSSDKWTPVMEHVKNEKLKGFAKSELERLLDVKSEEKCAWYVPYFRTHY